MQKGKYELLIKNLELDNVVIFGLSTRAEACYDWFVTHFPNVKIIGFIPDSSTEKQSFCGVSVLSVDDIKQKQEVVIIYAERDVSNIENLKIKHGLKNDFYIFYYVKPFFDTGDRSYPEQEIRDLYQLNDTETNMFLENFFLAKQHGWSLLLSLDSLDWIAKYNKKYWDMDDNDLSIYDELTFLDCGAYTGDSLEDFAKQYGDKLKYAYALEADNTKQESLKNTALILGIADSTQIIMKGVNDVAGDFFVENIGSTTGKVVEDGEHSAQTTRIDDLSVQPIGKLCIKMDVEGFEMPALKGAAEAIKEFKPEMAICIYHQTSDIFEIPKYIRSLCLEYRFIIRGGVHTVCYCSTSRF